MVCSSFVDSSYILIRVTVPSHRDWDSESLCQQLTFSLSAEDIPEYNGNV